MSVTYVLYIGAELPSNLLLKKIGPKILLPAMCFTWGVVTTLQCLVRSYSGLLGVRLMLGLAEGGKLHGEIPLIGNCYHHNTMLGLNANTNR